MKIAIYGKSFDKSFVKSITELLQILDKKALQILIYTPFFDFLNSRTNISLSKIKTFTKHEEVERNVDYLFSIGGDGTFLEAVSMVRNKGIPIVGINAGRLGFLASISEKEISQALNAIFQKKYSIEERILVELVTDENIDVFNGFNFALNEIAIQKKNSKMITIHVYADGEYLNSYWTDGLIISTPTGSTAYSLSVGGPIIIPELENIIISPIAPHNLTVRPIVVPGNTDLDFKIDARSEEYLVSVDYRSRILNTEVALKIRKADYKIRTIKLDNTSFFKTLRNKLMWGLDNRN